MAYRQIALETKKQSILCASKTIFYTSSFLNQSRSILYGVLLMFRMGVAYGRDADHENHFL
jgi:hypothetical protein